MYTTREHHSARFADMMIVFFSRVCIARLAAMMVKLFLEL